MLAGWVSGGSDGGEGQFRLPVTSFVVPFSPNASIEIRIGEVRAQISNIHLSHIA